MSTFLSMGFTSSCATSRDLPTPRIFRNGNRIGVSVFNKSNQSTDHGKMDKFTGLTG